MSKNMVVHHTAVLDVAHVGDIHGAFGSISIDDTGMRTTWKARLVTLLAIMGPGLIVMVGDNDAGGVATYAQAGQNFGTSLLWVLLLLVPVLIVNQEMVVRLGLVTGVGHARLIFERFGKFWGIFSVGDLFLLNILTVITEFIGIVLSMQHFGVSPLISVTLAAFFLIAMTVTGSFRRWERLMYLMVLINLLVLPMMFLSHPTVMPLVKSLVPGIKGGLTSNALLLIVGMVGTTVAPWQLFFQQSNVIDKRLTPRWMAYERADTIIGSFVVILGAAAIIICTAFAFQGTPLFGQFMDAGSVIRGLSAHVSKLSGDLFAIILLNSSLIGAAAVTLSTSYAFGDVFGVKHSLHRSVKDGKGFYIAYTAVIVVAALVVLIPHAPLGLITMAVQALAGILLPSATVFLLLLCNDVAVLGPWVNKTWVNVVAFIIVSVLVMLSLILATSTFFPTLSVWSLLEGSAALLTVGLFVAATIFLATLKTRSPREVPLGDKASWRMPSLHSLGKPRWSLGQKWGMLALRGYLVIAVVMLLVKVIQLTLHG